MPKFKDLTGKKFGRLTVTQQDASRHERPFWECLCECGSTTSVQSGSLVSGSTRSCGCLRREGTRLSHVHAKNKTSDPPVKEYTAWISMRKRCNNPTHRSYPRYGGRGIYICDQWSDYSAFLRDMGSAPSKSHSIDRIDNNGPYSPENCRWATATEQTRNRSSNKILECRGERLVVSEWESRMGLARGVIRNRIEELGWSIEDAILTPSCGSSYATAHRMQSKHLLKFPGKAKCQHGTDGRRDNG